MKHALAILILCLLPQAGWGANTFFVNQAGTGDGTTYNTAMSVATHGASTFSAGDIIYLCGAITSQLVPPSSGAAGNPITYGLDYGVSPCSTLTAVARDIYINAKDYITIRGGTVGGGTSQNIYVVDAKEPKLLGINFSGAPTGLYVNKCTDFVISGCSGNATNAAQYLARVDSSASTGMISGNSCVNTAGFGIYLNGVSSVALFGNSIYSSQLAALYVVGIDGQNVSVSSEDYYKNGLAGAGVDSTVYHNASSKSGITFTMTGGSIRSATNNGIYILNGSFASGYVTASTISDSTNGNGIYLNNVAGGFRITDNTISGNALDSMYLSSATGVVVRGNDTRNAGRDGISIDNATSYSTNENNLVYASGQTDTLSYGDGITSHAGCTSTVIRFNRIVGNRNSGMAMVLDASGMAYNNTFLNNGDSTSTNMGVRGGIYFTPSTPVGSWTVYNNILEGNYPNEIRGNSDGLGSLKADYNVFNHSGLGVAYNTSGTTYTTLADWQAAYGEDVNSVNADPLLDSSYKLQSGSPAKHTGTPAHEVSLTGNQTDSSGNVRYIGPYYRLDIGAYPFDSWIGQSIRGGTFYGGRFMP